MTLATDAMKRGSPASPRKLMCPRKGRSEQTMRARAGMEAARASRSKRTSGLSRVLRSDILPRSLGINEHGACDDGPDHLSRCQRNLHGFADALAAVLHECERDRAFQARAEVTRRHMTEHGNRHRCFRVLDDRAAFGQYFVGIFGEEPDELLATLACGVRPGERTTTDEVLALGDDHCIPRSIGVTEPSVSWPMMMKPFSARSTCIASVP